MVTGLLVPVETEPAEAAFSGANDKIAVASNRTAGPGVNNPEGENELFAMKPDGTGFEQLTVSTTVDYDLRPPGPEQPATAAGQPRKIGKKY